MWYNADKKDEMQNNILRLKSKINRRNKFEKFCAFRRRSEAKAKKGMISIYGFFRISKGKIFCKKNERGKNKSRRFK